MIDEYVRELDAALRGPRRAKADLLAEARDSLVDATEAYERAGLPRREAEQLAVTDFGTLEEIVPGYQTELRWTQGRHTVLTVLLVFTAQPFLWGHVYRWLANPQTEPPYALEETVENLGGATILLALCGVLAYRVGMRHPAVRSRLTRVTGVATLMVCTTLVSLSTSLAALANTSPLWTVVFILVPMGWITVSAHRCLTT